MRPVVPPDRSRRRWAVRLLSACLPLPSLRAHAHGEGFAVVFINPGRSDEAYWVIAGRAMQAAAHSLGLRLEQLFAERDPQRAIALAQQVAARPAAERPDYAVVVNEKGALVSSVRVLQAAGIRCMAAFSGLLPQERAQWAPRHGLPGLLGSLEPLADEAGYQTAKSLIRQALRERRQDAQGRLPLLAIAGDRSTPVSIARNAGMRRAVAEHAEVELVQVLFADWQRERARELVRTLLPRLPDLRLVWAGSDQMAFGAMEALEASGRLPGRQVLFSAINTSDEALQALQQGRLSALSGGHFLAGAFALVMLHDFHHGRDFADLGLELQLPMFVEFDAAFARRVQLRQQQGLQGVDFRRYSRALNPLLRRYPFDVRAVLGG